MPEQRPRRERPAVVANPPQLLAGIRVVGHQPLGARADQLQPGGRFDHDRRAEGFADVAVEGAEVDRAVGFPDRLAGQLVERHDVLHVASVDVKDQQLAEQDRRRAGPLVMIALEIAPRPKHGPAGRIQAGRAVASVVHPNPAFFDHRSGRSVAGHAGDVVGIFGVEDLHVVHDLAALAIDAHGKHLMPVGRGRGHPDLVAPDHGRGPAAIVDRGFPDDVLGIAPADGQACRVRMSVAAGPAKLGPVFAGIRQRGKQRKNQPGQECIVWLSNSGVRPGRNRPPQALLNATGSPDARLRPVRRFAALCPLSPPAAADRWPAGIHSPQQRPRPRGSVRHPGGVFGWRV